MLYPKSPQRTDKRINYDTWLNAFDQVRKLHNLNFDHSYFITHEDPTGFYITFDPSSVSQTNEEFDFKVEANASSTTSTTFIVRGGIVARDSKNIQYKMGLSLDAGTWDENGSYDNDYKSINVAANAVSFVYVELNNKILPTTLTANSSLTWPGWDANKDRFVLARVNSYSHTVEQYFMKGGDVHDEVSQSDGNKPSPDTESLFCNNTSGRTELFNFPSPVDTPMVIGDLVVFRDATGGTAGVAKVNYTSKVLAAGHSDTSGSSTTSGYADYAGVAALANVASSGWPTTWDHVTQITNKATDDHPAYLCDVLLRMADGQSYRTSGTITAGKFVVTGGATNEWDLLNFVANVSSDVIIHANNSITLDADNFIAVTCPTYSNCSTSSTLMQSVGNVTSLSTGGFIKLDGDAGVIIDSDDDMRIVATGDINMDGVDVDIYGSNSLKISAQGGRAILLDSDIDLQSGGQLQVNGTPGVTMTGYSVLDTTTGELHSIATTKGLMTTG